MGAMVWAHSLVGGSALALVVWRLAMRLTHGVPPPPATMPLQLAAHIAHWALYTLMVPFPVTRLSAPFGGVTGLAGGHEKQSLSPSF